MIRRLIITGALLCFAPLLISAQGFRIGDSASITSALSTPGVISTLPATINICTSPANAVPCTNKATTYTSVTLATPCSTSTQVVLAGTNNCVAGTDARGNWGAWVAAGNYDFTITVNTGLNFGPFTVSVGIPSGTNLNLGTTNACTINGVFVVGPGAPFTTCWGSSDVGAQMNAVNTAATSQGVPANIEVVAGQYNFSTAVTITKAGAIRCQGGPGGFTDGTILNWTPATGIAVTLNTALTSFIWEGCGLKTTTSTTSQALLMKNCFTCSVSKFNFNGFNGGGITVTGDGVSSNSLGVRIYDGIVQNFCGTGSYGVSFDHVLDLAYSMVEVYSNTNCTTSQAGIIDTGAQGLNLSFGTFEQGLHALVIQNTNRGGAYGGAPAAMWMNSITPDAATGGDTFLFDSSLGGSDLKFFSWNLWSAFAGRQGSGTIVTNTAVGIRIAGGSNIHFKGGIVRGSANWGMVISTAGSDISVDDVNFLTNNACGHATCPNVGGIQVTAAPSFVRLTNNRSGNAVEPCPNAPCQDYGIDLSAVTSPTVYWAMNDLRLNNLGRIRMPAGLGAAAIDAPELGNLTGIMLNGELIMPISGCTGVGVSHVVWCNGAGAAQINNNNAGAFNVGQAIGTGNVTTAGTAITTLTCQAQTNITVTGALTTDNVIPNIGATLPATWQTGIVLSAHVTAPNTVTVYLCNPTAGSITPVATQVNVRVER